MSLIITLIIVGILLIVAEILILPGVFIAGTVGLASLVGSCYLAFQQYGQTGGIVAISVNVILLVIFTVYSLRSKTWKKISLTTKIDNSIDHKPLEKGLDIGTIGTTLSRLSPMGKANFDGRIVEVNARNEMVNQGSEVEITLIEDNIIYVKLK